MTDSRPGDIFQPGDLLNNTYRIQSLLGRGGTSEVYQAKSEISGRIVALKALKSEFSTNDDYLVLMTREEDVRDVRHDAIVRYYDNQRMPDGQVYLIMDYVDGPGLDEKLKSGGMSVDYILTIGARVSEGLIAAHSRNIVHRDLSPDNIILRNNDPADAVIIDFGIAKDTNPGAETIVGNEFAGKYAYAAPEQLSGTTDARSDIYALGALLLATFRGQKPDMGSNPMQVVQFKSQPVNVDGVPEPLKTLIARMCDPDPDKRFQTAVEVLAAFNKVRGHAPVGDDATVIVPKQAGKSTNSKPGSRATGTGQKARNKRGMLAIILLAGLLVAGGIGGYFSGVFDGFTGSRLPVADPYILVVEKGANTVPRAVGNVPSTETLTALTDLIERSGGTAALTMASGDIGETWGDAMLVLVDQASQLDEYRIIFEGRKVRITGLTANRTLRATMTETLNAALPGDLTGKVEIVQGPRILHPSKLDPLLQQFANCGPLTFASRPTIGFGLTDSIVVIGKLADAEKRAALRNAIAEIAGDRPVTIDTDLLSKTLCQIEAALPDAPSGGFSVVFGFGDRTDPNPTGRYFVGENPVIDVEIPAHITSGFLWVSVLDISGNVFHLMPNLNRQDNSIKTLRAGQSGQVLVRVAFGLAQAADSGRIAFLVDDSTLGKSRILVLHSESDPFNGVRPTTESAASYANALKDARDIGDLRIRSLDSGILTTAKK